MPRPLNPRAGTPRPSRPPRGTPPRPPSLWTGTPSQPVLGPPPGTPPASRPKLGPPPRPRRPWVWPPPPSQPTQGTPLPPLSPRNGPHSPSPPRRGDTPAIRTRVPGPLRQADGVVAPALLPPSPAGSPPASALRPGALLRVPRPRPPRSLPHRRRSSPRGGDRPARGEDDRPVVAVGGRRRGPARDVPGPGRNGARRPSRGRAPTVGVCCCGHGQ